MNTTTDAPAVARTVRRGLQTIACWFCAVGIAAAQDAAPAGQEGSAVVVSGRPLYMEIGLLLLLFGAVLFAVCRSSSRN